MKNEWNEKWKMKWMKWKMKNEKWKMNEVKNEMNEWNEMKWHEMKKMNEMIGVDVDEYEVKFPGRLKYRLRR